MGIHRYPKRVMVLGVVLASICSVSCAVPAAPLIGAITGTTTVSGSVQDAAEDSRVGLFGAPQAGGPQVELNSVSITDGQYSLAFPASPPINLMEQPDETRSVVCSLRVYADSNKNRRHDDAESLGQPSGPSFRYFAESSSRSGHSAGWNVFRNGTFSKATQISAGLSYSLAHLRR